MAIIDEKDQETLINLMISDSNTFSRLKSIIRPEYFDKKFHKTINYILDFSEKYNTLPSIEQLNNETRLNYRIIENVKTNINLQNSVLDSVEMFCKRRALENAILQATDMINKGESTGIDKIIKDAQLISIKKDLGIDFWSDQEEWLKHLELEMGVVKTGWDTFDNIINGGFSWGSLTYVVSAAGGGKSITMANLGLNLSCLGYNVAYITLELDQELVGKRILSMASNIPYKEISEKQNRTVESVNYKKNSINPGIFQIINMPNGCSTQDIESLIQELEIATNKVINIIIVDYADIMRPNDRRVDPNNMHLSGKCIAEDLRGMVRERTRNGKKSLIITASQISKDTMDEMEYSQSNIAGSRGKVDTADLIFSVKTNLSMRAKGLYELKFLKTRNSGGTDKKLKLKYNIDTLLMTDIEEVDDNNISNGFEDNIKNGLETFNKLQLLNS